MNSMSDMRDSDDRIASGQMIEDRPAKDHPWRYSKVRFASFHTPLAVSVEGSEGAALGCFYAEVDSNWPNDAKLVYLVSFPREPRPRLVQAGEITGQRVGQL
jgi:hypothetical protein